MKALLYKDFISIKKTLLLMGVLVLIIGIYSYTQKQLIAFPMIFLMIPLILMGTLFGADNRSHTSVYLVPAPVSRTTIVLSRYACGWFFAALGALVSILISIWAPDQALPLPSYFVAVVLLFTITSITAIQLPLLFKFNKDQAQILFVILYFIIFAGFSWLGPKLKDLFQASEPFAGLPISILTLGLLTLTIIMNFLSVGVSINIFKKKEF